MEEQNDIKTVSLNNNPIEKNSISPLKILKANNQNQTIFKQNRWNRINPNIEQSKTFETVRNMNYGINNLSNFQFYNQIKSRQLLNSSIQSLKELQKQKSDFYKLREKGLQGLSNVQNINHYLIKDKQNNSTIKETPNYFPKNSKERQLFQQVETKKDMKSYKNGNSEKKIEINDIKEGNSINIQDIISGEETRTVIRLCPIPPNYTSYEVSKLLDKYLHIEAKKNQRIYKALYVPLCKKIGKNLGYCFVMLVKPKYVIDFYNTFNGKMLKKKKCKKPCKIIWANIQGDDFINISDDPLRSPIILRT